MKKVPIAPIATLANEPRKKATKGPGGRKQRTGLDWGGNRKPPKSKGKGKILERAKQVLHRSGT